MIKYSLVCDKGHEFESWFADSDAFDTQAKRGFAEVVVEFQVSPVVRVGDCAIKFPA